MYAHSIIVFPSFIFWVPPHTFQWKCPIPLGPPDLTIFRTTRATRRRPKLYCNHSERVGQTFCDGSEVERVCWDPKDGELCLNRVKPEETLVEARSDSDVQIDRRIWV